MLLAAALPNLIGYQFRNAIVRAQIRGESADMLCNAVPVDRAIVTRDHHRPVLR
jgi:hypothetical protein